MTKISLDVPEIGQVAVDVGDMVPVVINGVPEGKAGGFMGLAVGEFNSYVRNFWEDPENPVRRGSDVVRLSNTTSPSVFEWEERITSCKTAGVLAFEDPTIVPGGGYVACTKVTPAYRRVSTDWFADIAIVGENGDVETMLSRLEMPIDDTSGVKEPEFFTGPDGVKRALFEVDTPRAGIIGLGEMSEDGKKILNPRQAINPRHPKDDPSIPGGRPKIVPWDSTHVSPGPILGCYDDVICALYNGRAQTGDISNPRYEWQIGLIWFKLVPNSKGIMMPKELYRSEPIIRDDREEVGYGEQVIAFCSSAMKVGNDKWYVYYHIADNKCAMRELTISRTGA